MQGVLHEVLWLINPNVAALLPAKTAKLAPVHAICALAGLGQDLTYGEVRFDLPETVRGHIWRTLARFSSAHSCSLRVKFDLRDITCVLAYAKIAIMVREPCDAGEMGISRWLNLGKEQEVCHLELQA